MKNDHIYVAVCTVASFKQIPIGFTPVGDITVYFDIGRSLKMTVMSQTCKKII